MIDIKEADVGFGYIELTLYSRNELNKYGYLDIGYLFPSESDILFSLIPEYSKMDSNKIVYIRDIVVYKRRQGYGSILLDYLTQKAIKEEYLYIIGWLSNEAKDRFSELETFYKKNGFSVYFTEAKDQGIIIKNIS